MKYIKKHPTLLKEEINSDFIYNKLAKAANSDKSNTELKKLLDDFISADETKKQDSNYWISKLDSVYKGVSNNNTGASASAPINQTLTNPPQSASASTTNDISTDKTTGGTFSVTAPTQGASASIPLTIDGLFGTIFKQEERQKWGMTDEDYKKMEYIGTQPVESWSYTPDDTDKDPIIKIVDLFQQAHQLYFTPQIPTGRPLGKVSQKTYLEYTYVGKESGGSQWTEERAPNGPFIVNSIFNKWRDGIEKIFQDKEMRKIFANSKFKVKNTTVVEEPNKQTKLESIQFINEAEQATATPSGNDKQGQIIFTFMRNMLDKNKLADFDSNKNKLMFDYFGIKGDSVDKVTYNGIHKPNKRDTDPNELRWQTTDCKYNELDKKLFLLAMNNETIYFCVGLAHEQILPKDYKKDGKRVNGTYFYYWENDDKEIRDWATSKYPKLKLQNVLDKLNVKKQCGIGFLDSLNDSGDTIKKNQCEWYLMKSPGGMDYKYVEVEKYDNKYPTKKVGSQLDKPLKKYDRDLISYMQLTSGVANYYSSEELYNKYIGSLSTSVKEKFKKAVTDRKNQSE
jgi:hypothetical protein